MEKITDERIEELMNYFMPRLFELHTFKDDEIELLKIAWKQGAKVIMNYIINIEDEHYVKDINELIKSTYLWKKKNYMQ